jgi:serine/threonine protein kinase/tetratricopeptide (TPR) repeat protein
MSDTEVRPRLSPAEARQIDQACDRFEAAWKAGQRPRPEEYLAPASEPARSALLRQLLILDWDYRRRAGEHPCPSDYHALFPGDAALIEAARQAMAESRPGARTSDPADPQEANRQAPTGPPEPFQEGPGTRVGPYKLLQQIGEGGMGTVFMAEQTEPVHRKVALKIIKPGMDSKQVIARFEAERQALALMDHQNIAKVLDAGTTPLTDVRGSGRPYFVMELVHGVPITQFCDDRKLMPRQRLELFVPVCQAIQHAHQKGIIHRDIKPSNVLVTMYDDQPVPKVIDFGVAKAVEQRLTDKTMFTQFGAMVGTLEYMSPEQADLSAFGIDTRSDIYSLGVLLYELLTGTTPLEHKRLRQAALAEMVRLIKEEEAPRPSVRLSSSHNLAKIAAARNTEPARLSRLIRGDIDWIVMKCLEKDRTRRYESASGLARDIQRHLADEPVEACPPSAAYRLRKFVRRNKGRVLAAAALAVSLLVGAAAVLAVEANAERERAAEAADRAVREAGTTASVAEAVREARERAAEAWNLHDFPDRMQRATDAAVAAIRRADGFVAGGTPTEATLAELASARQAVDELARHTRLITACDASSQKFADELGARDVRDARADHARRHGQAFKQFGLDPIHGPTKEIARTIVASRARDALLGMLLQWHFHAEYLWRIRRKNPAVVRAFPDADPVVKDRLAQVVRSARQLCGGAYARWQDLLDRKDVPGLVAFAASPDGLSFRSTLVHALGRDLLRAKQYAACRSFLRAAVDRYPHDVWLHHDLFNVCQYGKAPDYAEALREASARSVLRPDSVKFHYDVGDCYIGLKSYDHAVVAFRKAIRLNPNYLWAHVNLGYSLGRTDRHAEALQVVLDALRQHPDWAEDPRNNFRNNAACYSLRCADGKGVNAPPPAERPAYRKQALEFFTADLAALRKLAATDRVFVHARMQLWLGDEDAASVQDPMALKRLPADERDAWTKLWADFRDLRDRTAPPTSPARGEKASGGKTR